VEILEHIATPAARHLLGDLVRARGSHRQPGNLWTVSKPREQARRDAAGALRTRPGAVARPTPRGRSDRRAQRPSSLAVVARAASIPRVASSAGAVGWSARFGLTIVSFRQACQRR